MIGASTSSIAMAMSGTVHKADLGSWSCGADGPEVSLVLRNRRQRAINVVLGVALSLAFGLIFEYPSTSR